MRSNIYATTILHDRVFPFKHKFKYSLLSLYIDLDELPMISKKIKIFSYNKFNLFSFNELDHGYRDGRSLRDFVKNILKKNNFIFNNLKIKIFCFPRVLGYVFNPLSIIYCFDDDELKSIFYEVKNTSNEQHTYFFASYSSSKNKKIFTHTCNKNFYVSPFIGMKSVYKFTNTLPEKKMSISIDLYDDKEQKIIRAAQYGIKMSLSSFVLFKQLLFNPFFSLKVMSAILYEAFLIVFRGGKYYARNKKILDTITFEGEI